MTGHPFFLDKKQRKLVKNTKSNKPSPDKSVINRWG